MNDKDPFAETNPFLQLKGKDFSRREPLSAVPAKDKRREKKHDCEETQDDDSRLFLQAAHALPFPASRQARSCDACNAESSASDEHAMDFVKAMRDVQPLHGGRGRDVPRVVEPPAVVETQEQAFPALVENTLDFALIFSEEYIEGHVVGLDSLILQKLRAGRYSPEAHLDLHGLNARQAFDALVGFARSGWHRGLRVLLLIPGRGRNSPDGVAVLRERVQGWLTQEPLKRVVLAFCTARPADGGPGSLYVLLRKYRKKGKISWERCPVDLGL
ncbi:MAG: Smr/MutS family protein [Deltaproteobacteria bacterium]|jgi:DNA-nicking Smr family endonuclease|nr:Smr/MutS family protein [Deltaproteobacteria bacterium]